MITEIDNLEYNNTDSFNIINEDNDENLFNLNNTDYFSFNPKNVNPNEDKEFQLVNGYNLLNNKLKRNPCNLKELGFKEDLLIKHLGNKKAKIFNIIHIEKESNVDINEDIEQGLKSNKILSKRDENLKYENNDSKYIFQVLVNKKDNNNNFQIKTSFDDKSNDEGKKMKHDKFFDDNLRKKCKHLVLHNLMIFINKKIFSIYEGNIGNNIYRKELLTLNKSQKSKANLLYERLFVNKKISDILSDNISTRYTNFLPEHNKILIERLRNDEDEYKRVYFNKLFDLTFKECLGNFIGKKPIEELEGMKGFDSIKDSLGEDEEYINLIKYYLDNFEKIINNKNPRRSRKSQKSNQIKYENKKNIK